MLILVIGQGWSCAMSSVTSRAQPQQPAHRRLPLILETKKQLRRHSLAHNLATLQDQQQVTNGTQEGVAATTAAAPFYTLSRVLLHSLLSKSAKECDQLQKQQSRKTIMAIGSSIAERDREVHWILMLGRRFHLGLSTLGLSIAILDRLLRLVKVHGKYLHCLAVAALVLAIKFHEEIDADSEAFEANRETAMLLAIPSPEPLNADDLAAKIRSSSFFSQKELNRMERTLLARLEWDLLLPSFDRFLQAMLAVIGAPHLAASGVLRRNFELVVSSGQLVWSYSTSVLALSLLSIMLEFTSPEWPRITHSLKNIFQIDDFNLMKCRQETAELLRDHFWELKSPQGKQLYTGVRWLRPSTTANRKSKKHHGKQQPSIGGGGTAKNTKYRRPSFGAFVAEEEGSAQQQQMALEQ